MTRDPFLFAIVQHPMILLIHEDRGVPPVGERVAPWGAPDIGEYAERVRRNLEALRKHPELKLNYEFSGVELEILAEHAPDTIASMRQMAEEGRLAFLGGDYSQPHGQLYSGELNYRQLEEGLKTMLALVNYRVTSNFHQETCLHDQMPQLLKAFGFLTACPPAFAHTITPLPGSGYPDMVASICHAYAPVARDSVCLWQGLDGTELPLVIPAIGAVTFNAERLRDELHKGLYRFSPLVIHPPDLEEISDEVCNLIKEMGSPVLLDQAALEQVERNAPRWKARLHSYWSYAEGEWAESVCRHIRSTESALLAEEALSAVAGSAPRSDINSDWRTMMAAMHHDVHWLEVTDLKQTYLNRMEEVRKRSRSKLAKVVRAEAGAPSMGQAFRVVNPLAFSRREIVRLTVLSDKSPSVKSASGTEIP